MTDSPLTLQRIFASTEFADEGFDRPRWSSKGSFYTTLRKYTSPILNSSEGSTVTNNSSSDLTATTASAMQKASSLVFEIIWHDAATGESSTLVSHSQLIPQGEDIEGNKNSPLTIDDYTISEDKFKVLIFTNAQKVWRLCTRGSYWILDLTNHEDSNNSIPSLRQLGGKDGPRSDLMFATFSPDSSKVAYVRKHNIFVEDLTTNEIIPLTTNGSDLIINGTFDWVYEEEFHMLNGFRWSPDGSRIAYWQIDQTDVSVLTLINNTDSLYPKLIPIHYPKAGQTNPSAKIGTVSVLGGETLWLNIEGDSRDNYLADMDFSSSTGQIIIQQLNRLQNTLKVLIADPLSGEVTQAFIDKDDAWIDIMHQLRWVRNGKQFVYISDRGGWKQCYLISLPTAAASAEDETALISTLTPAGMDIESIVGCDETLEVVYFIASPDDPLCRYLYRVNFDGSSLTRVTPTCDEFIGTNGYSLSSDAKYAVHTFSTFNRPSITRIISLPSHEEQVLLASNLKLLSKFNEISSPAIDPIEYFTVDINEYVQLNAWCIHPPGFDPSNKYPVIFHVYGEPAAQIVRKQWGGRLALWHRMLAQRGAVVICIDNRGTPCLKGRAWRKVIYRQVGILASADQASAVQSIVASRRYLDEARVAVWGWSGGGSMSLNALFRYPNIYTTAVSVAPVPDMRLYDTIYQERYMGLPDDNADGYKHGSPITYASQMKSSQNLLLIHGTGDDNCHYQGTELLINELIKHNKPFQMLSYPNRSHSISEGPNTTLHLFEQITRFFQSVKMIN